MRRHDGERVDPRDVLDGYELADYYATRRLEAEPARRGGLPRINSDGYDQSGDFHGMPGHWDWTGADE